MERTHHCQLCDHQEVTLKEGSVCGLTDRKPEFNRTCSKILLNEKFQQKFLDAVVHYQQIVKRRAWVHGYFTVFMIVGILVVIGAGWFTYYLLNLTERVGVISTVPLIIGGVGIAVMAMANGARNKYLKDMGEAEQKLEKIDSVLEVYNIKYDVDLRLGKTYHGKQEIAADVRFSGGLAENFSWIGEGPSRRW